MDLSADFLVKETLRALLLPPGLLMLLFAAALLFWRTFGKTLAAVAALLLWGLATPFVASWLMARVEAPPLALGASSVDAIVCLGGGKRSQAYDMPGRETVNAETLERLRQTARLARLTGKPVLVSGGAPVGGKAEAELMREVLETDFHVPVRWVESHSSDTRDNAIMSAAQLLPRHRQILLVSSAYHLPRAGRAFESAGFAVTLAPTGYANREPTSYLSFLPQAKAFHTSHTALRELVGKAWYQLRNANQ